MEKNTEVFNQIRNKIVTNNNLIEKVNFQLQKHGKTRGPDKINVNIVVH